MFEQELQRNREAYEALRDQIRQEYAGQYVAIAQGRLIAASADFDEALAVVQRLQPAPEHYVVFPANEEPAFEPVEAYHQDWL
jgi:hypothetical protein